MDVEIKEILTKFGKRAFNIAYHFTGNYEDAQDLAQEAFVKVLIAVRDGKYNPDLPMESYLYKIIQNIYIDGMRKKPKVQVFSLDEISPYVEEQKIESIQDFHSDPQIILEKQTSAENIQRILGQIPSKFRMPLILSDIEGFSYEKIGGILNCPIGTVRSRIHRGRKSLTELLSKAADYKK